MSNWLGDVVMNTPTIDRLLEHFPAAELVAVGPPAVAKLLAGDPRFLALEADRTKSGHLRAIRLWQLGRRLRRQYGPFDLAWCFPNSFSARLLLLASGAPIRVGRRRGFGSGLLTHAIDCKPGAHAAEALYQVADGYFQEPQPVRPTSLHVAQRYRYPRSTVGINPGAAYGDVRRWPSNRFGEVAATLARDHDIVIFGGPDERDLAREIEESLRAAGCTNFRNVAGCTLPEMLTWISGLDLFVTNDTGPMHIAGAFAVPIVGIFGPTDPSHSRPWSHGGLETIRHPVNCSPCSHRQCPLADHPCLQEITPQQVIRAARSLLASYPRQTAREVA